MEPPSRSYDVVVIGSGYGGSVSAFRLAQAGFNVCILEKGRQWQPHEFPSSFWQLLPNTRLHTPFGNIGRRDALYQVYFQGVVLAVVGVGLGGGSLINGGVILQTPARARRDPRWPLKWNREWHSSELRTRAVLQPESASHEFLQSRVMDAVAGEIEDCTKDRVDLSIRFKDTKSEAQNVCTGCGNCFVGCPYNAKNSLDKNYVAAAIHAGASVVTGIEARYVLPNYRQLTTCGQDCCYTECMREKGGDHGDHCENLSDKGRRWRVCLDETEYITADFVIVSAGVLGTTKILVQSKMRGLALSEMLGRGISCNGNNVAFISGTRVATKAYGLSRHALADTSILDRPGPSITSSYTSSLGFTIQGAALPKGYPFMLFQCIAQHGFFFGFFYGIWHKLKYFLRTWDSDSLVLNIMGHDSADGRIEFDKDSRLVKFIPPTDTLIPKKINTIENITKRLGGVMFMPTLRNSTVHLLGGCTVGNNSMKGVTNSDGQVFCPTTSKIEENDVLRSCSPAQEVFDRVHEGLYVCDSSIIPCAVGVNPSFTIATVAEHISRSLVQHAALYYNGKTAIRSEQGDPPTARSENVVSRRRALRNPEAMPEQQSATSTSAQRLVQHDVKEELERRVRIRETLEGKLESLPCRLQVVMDMGRTARDEGYEGEGIEGDDGILRGRVGGTLEMRALETGLLHIVNGIVDMRWMSCRTPFSQYMHYHLLLASSNGALYTLDGRKEMRPFMLGANAWAESTTLNVILRRVPTDLNQTVETLRGTLHVSFVGLLRSFLSMQGPLQLRWRFVSALLCSIFRTYFASTACPRPLLSPHQQFCNQETLPQESSYPKHVVHDIITGDGTHISCWQWPLICHPTNSADCNVNEEKWLPESLRTRSCVLLLNGYSGESYYLPTEENDLVRTLLKNGYEPWLLRLRLHFSHCTTTPFTLDDIAQFDLPAAFSKIAEERGKQAPVHVVAHCIGGLVIHMALLGGHVRVSSVASLTCTNSSMFFDVTPLAMVKLSLPLIPISMRLLGKNTVLAFTDSPSESWRHRLLKRVSEIIPTVERCTCRECNLFSGIFGNAFWHENVKETVHEWISKKTLVRLPATGFLQLRTICRAGKIVSWNGENKYLPFIERLTVPTTYISGGRSLLVTPKTSERAHALMQLHHPHLCHRRHLIHGYGHSDLLIGEFSARDVFPFILDSFSLSGQRVKTAPTSTSMQLWKVSCRPRFRFHHLIRIFLVVIFVAALLAYSQLGSKLEKSWREGLS